MQATGTFAELEAETNRPRAWNFEMGYFAGDNLEMALRIEGSKELEDEPRLQAGLAVTLHAVENVTATIEVLKGSFKRGLAKDSNGNELDRQYLLAAQLGISF